MSSSEFLAALQAAGLGTLRLEVVADSRLHRFRVEADKAGNLNGWYVADFTEPAHAVFGSWRTGQTYVWRPARQDRLTDAEREVLAKRRAAARVARDAEQARVHADARERAARLWLRAKPAFGSHPYLVQKGVGAFGIRDLRGQLVIPARDTEGTLHTLQFVAADGRKTFLTGGRKRACYHAIGIPRGVLCLCEGYATGATVFAATGHATAVAFDCHNLEPVARALRAKFPGLAMCVAADDDAQTPGNPGVTAARRAALAVGAALAVPSFDRMAHD
ncbi:hypothetical protein [Accumulibacter sp.]|uniref:hypothetical protein n=1 Tax=Accumulibacter sp. TaxID=2053492 RepID=UPI0025873390|nr:hypothetical protein [Accumulibacter sp.]